MFPVLRSIHLPLHLFKTFLDDIRLVQIQRNFSLTSITRVKRIVETQQDNTLIIEGVIEKSPRENLLVKPESESKACPLCSLGLDIMHTDVLILSQFVRQNGQMLPRRVTGLCCMQQKRVTTMVAMAHKAGLMGKFKPETCTYDPRNRRDWKKWNTYFDENTITAPKLSLHLKYKKKIDQFKESQKESK